MRVSGLRPLILAVDDDQGIHETYRLIFEEKYELISAFDGPEALEILRSKPVDLMLLDVRMPGMDGFAVLEQAKRVRPTLPVIIVSALDNARSGWSAGRLGAVEYLTRPWNPDHLEKTVRRVIDGDVNSTSANPDNATPRVIVLSANVGTRAGLVALLSLQCRVDGARSLTGAAEAARSGPPDLIIFDVAGLAQPEPSAVARLCGFFPDVPRLVVGSSDVLGIHMEAGTKSPTVVLGAFVAERVVHEASELLATRPWLTAVRPPGRLASRAVQYIITNFPKLTVDDIAHAVNVSPSYLCRKFSAEMSALTPKDFLERVQIEAAKCLLKETAEKIDTIAELVGFYDAPHLTRVFRRHTGQTPRTYRQI